MMVPNVFTVYRRQRYFYITVKTFLQTTPKNLTNSDKPNLLETMINKPFFASKKFAKFFPIPPPNLRTFVDICVEISSFYCQLPGGRTQKGPFTNYVDKLGGGRVSQMSTILLKVMFQTCQRRQGEGVKKIPKSCQRSL